ncbi:MAG TPA: fasciclin domain-containing protein [Candidatus Paceibacterota bacterium]|nr:fasciclin domain-containing protein [Candidatus Paceibacterota bacterium]
MDKQRDLWIGIIALGVIGALGLWWLFEISAISAPSTTAAIAATSATTSAPITPSPTLPPKPVDRSTQMVVAIAENLPGASEFASLMATSGVAARIKGVGPYTIFVPTDKAFSELPPGSISGLSPAAVKQLIAYHIITDRAVDPWAQVSGTVQSLSGDAINFNRGAGDIPLINSAIIIDAYKGKNGIVYLIDNVLIPPTLNQ